MDIGVTAEWLGTAAGGPERYVANLLRELAQLQRGHRYVAYTGSNNVALGIEDSSDEVAIESIGSSRWVSIPFGLPWRLLRRPVDLLHATYVAPPVCATPFVLTVLDLGFEIHPEFFPPLVRARLSLLMRWSVKRAAAIIAISEETKRTLIDLYGVEARRISVVPLGVERCFTDAPSQDDAAVRSCYKLPEQYILYVGKLQARKNVVRLLQAYQIARQSRSGMPDLVLVGRRTWRSDDIFAMLDALGLKPHVHFSGHVPDHHLPALYRGASFFVYPSLFEGFGIPLIEAMASGVPVACSNVSSLPEVAGDAAVLFDPYDEHDIAKQLTRLFDDAALRAHLVMRGFARARLYTWEETARKTLAVYEEVATSLAIPRAYHE